MSDHDLDEWFMQTASVETWQGTSGVGDVFATAVVVECFIEDARKLVRAKDGQQVISESTLYAPITYAGIFTSNSRITVLTDADGDEITPTRLTRVIQERARDGGSLDLPDHLEVTLE